MNAQRWKLFVLILTFGMLAGLITACAGIIPDTGQSPDALAATQQAFIEQAVRATATTGAMQTQIAQLETQVARPTDTPEPTATQVPPTATPTPTVTPVPPTATPSVPCNVAGFVDDVTIADGTILMPGTYFTKTWRLVNNGSCTWTRDYDLVYVGGDLMGGPGELPLPGSVAPGQQIDLSVSLTAPGSDGSYRGYWKLRDPNGTLFGINLKGSSFYVDIRVRTPSSDYPFDFAASYCSAEWSSGAGRLPCQGASDDSRGWVQRINNPVLESGYIDDEPVVRMQPQMITDGIIRGKYPAVRIENGHHFVAVIGCANKATHCDVYFQLAYQIGSGSIETLASWHEVYDEEFQLVEVDLSSLRGQDVNLILTVQANGSPNQDIAQWLAPRVVKK